MSSLNLITRLLPIIGLSVVPLVSAHMEVISPPIFRSRHNPNVPSELINFNVQDPLLPDGSNYPCGLGHLDVGKPEGAPTVTWQAGTEQTFQLDPKINDQGVPLAAAHNGGSCQVSFSFDGGATWKVVKSFEGNCARSNGKQQADTVKDQTYSFPIPPETRSGNALWAWTWWNNNGNREQYMNCAHVTITGGGTSTLNEGEYPDMFTANIQQGGCSTKSDTDVLFPNPGRVVERGDRGFFAPPEGDCSTPVRVSADKVAQGFDAGPPPPASSSSNVASTSNNNVANVNNAAANKSPTTTTSAPKQQFTTINGEVFVLEIKTVTAGSSQPAPTSNVASNSGTNTNSNKGSSGGGAAGTSSNTQQQAAYSYGGTGSGSAVKGNGATVQNDPEAAVYGAGYNRRSLLSASASSFLAKIKRNVGNTGQAFMELPSGLLSGVLGTLKSDLGSNTGPMVARDSIKHHVVAGDNCDSIAAAHGLTPADLQKFNSPPFECDNLPVGSDVYLRPMSRLFRV